jgi:hypothetical protein
VENCGTLAYEIPGLKPRALLLWLFLAFWLWEKPKKSTYLEAKRIGSLFMASKIQKPKSQKKATTKGPSVNQTRPLSFQNKCT